MILGAMFGLLILFEIQDSFADLLEYEAGAFNILRYYAILSPSFLTIVLPASILVSILYALGQLHRSNEIVAFRAAGMSVFRVTRPIWFACCCLSAALWHLNSSLIPWSVEESERLWLNIELNHESKTLEAQEVGLILDLAFDNRKDNRMWFINRYSQYNEQGFGIMVSVMDNQRRELRRYMARSGYYDATVGYWKLHEGREFKFDLEDDEKNSFQPFESMDAVELTDNPELMLLFGKRAKDLSFRQLKLITDNFTQEHNPKVLTYQAMLQSLMARAASCLIVAGIAIPFAISGVRTNPAVGVSKSIGLFFAYYLLSSVLSAMGRNGTLSPEWAAWAPTTFMILLAYLLLRRVK